MVTQANSQPEPHAPLFGLYCQEAGIFIRLPAGIDLSGVLGQISGPLPEETIQQIINLVQMQQGGPTPNNTNN